LRVLPGDRRDTWSIRINAPWRICFRREDGAHDVEIVVYHR
jgi:proteic killer suppression protein